MLRIRKIVPTTRSRITTRPVGPASPLLIVSPKLLSARIRIPFTALLLVAVPLLRYAGASGSSYRLRALDRLADAREQVILGQRGIDQGPGELEILGRPHRGLDLLRDPEPEPFRVDLGGVGLEGLVAHREVVRADDPGRDPLGRVARLVAVLPALEPVRVRRVETGGQHRLVDRHDPLLA